MELRLNKVDPHPSNIPNNGHTSSTGILYTQLPPYSGIPERIFAHGSQFCHWGPRCWSRMFSHIPL